MTTVERPNREVLDKALLVYRDAMRPFVINVLEGIPNTTVENAVCDSLPQNLQWRGERIHAAVAKGELLIDYIDTGDFPALIRNYWNVAFKHRFAGREIQTHCQHIHNSRNSVAHVPSADIGTEATRATLFHITEVLRLIDRPSEQLVVQGMIEGLADPRVQALADEIGQLTTRLNTQALEIETLQTSLDQALSQMDEIVDGLGEKIEESMQKGVEAALTASDSNLAATLTASIEAAFDRIAQGDPINEGDANEDGNANAEEEVNSWYTDFYHQLDVDGQEILVDGQLNDENQVRVLLYRGIDENPDNLLTGNEYLHAYATWRRSLNVMPTARYLCSRENCLFSSGTRRSWYNQDKAMEHEQAYGHEVWEFTL